MKEFFWFLVTYQRCNCDLEWQLAFLNGAWKGLLLGVTIATAYFVYSNVRQSK